MAPEMGIVWTQAPPGWAEVVYYPGAGVPSALTVRVRVAPTEDGLAADAVMVERTDGRAITARDLRTVKIPSAWVLSSGRPLLPPEAVSAVTAAGPGARRKSDAHWLSVYRLWLQAQQVAPHTPVRWMRAQWPGVPESTIRRWVKQARKRAEVNGWRNEITPGQNQRDDLERR